ncbi:MAG: hypothetical protein V7711_18415 [Pseudomonadales bacterium]
MNLTAWFNGTDVERLDAIPAAKLQLFIIEELRKMLAESKSAMRTSLWQERWAQVGITLT